MIPVIALNEVEMLESFKIEDVGAYEFNAYCMKNDPRAVRIAMAIIDGGKGLVMPGTQCVIACVRKSDRVIVTTVKITALVDCGAVDVIRSIDVKYNESIITSILNLGFEKANVEYIDQDTVQEARNKIVTVWESTHSRQDQMNVVEEVGPMAMEMSVEFTANATNSDSYNTFAEKKVRELRNIEDFGVANPKPC